MKINARRTAQRYFKFQGFLIFNPESKNLVGIDFKPRFRMTPTKLLEILSVSTRDKSVNFGYIKDSEQNLYFKNLDMSEMEALVEFNHIKNSPPFGYDGENDYVKYALAAFDKDYQSRLEKTYNSILKSGVKPMVDGKEFKVEIIDYVIRPLSFFKEREVPSQSAIKVFK